MTPSPFSANVLITGGAGFLGRGILRYMERNRIPGRVTVYSRDEQKHYALRSRWPQVRTVLGDIRDTDRLAAVMTGHDVVIHAAALKHIPEAERDVSEAVAVNLDGSRSVAQAAIRSGVHSVVGISTDKACSPRNAYGATKMLMERCFQEAGRLAPRTRFVNVRYGNVISSTGSVVPLFMDQFKRNGHASITSADMTRFWLSIDEAVKLIEFSLQGDGRKGYTYVYECPAMPVTDVAQAVWRLYSGLTTVMPSPRIIGLRPGEKLHEVLVDPSEAPFAMHDGNYILIPPALSMEGSVDTSRGDVMPYESSMPKRWLAPAEMVQLIQDAEHV